jgi:hypothetical protein
MSGVYHFEIEQWETALNSFLRCRTIYEQLSKVADSLQRILYKEKIEQIEQSIRYCNHKLNKGKDSFEKLVEDKTLTNDPTLSTRIEVVYLYCPFSLLGTFKCAKRKENG